MQAAGGSVQSYSVRDVERVLQLSRGTIRGLIAIGFVKPARGRRHEYRFSFQDLIVLRTARALIQAKVPRQRIRRCLRDLRRHLPGSAPLSGLSIRALGDRIVVREGQNDWDLGDGQYLLGFDVRVDQGVLRVRGTGAEAAAIAREGASAEELGAWFERGLELEVQDPSAALEAYRRVSERQPQHAGAWINRGRLLHALGRNDEAEQVYRSAIEHCGQDALLWFNLGVLLEDLARPRAALEAYQRAIEADHNFADGHYNLARLYEQLGKAQHAIRHLGQYRRLTISDTRC